MLRVAAVLLLLCIAVNADLYMHTPRGSNDRLNEAGRDRNNGNRLFDSQNNNRGGVNVGTFGRPYYYVGTMIPIEWSPQHSCGRDNNNNCEIIIQYYCDNNITRDGLTTDRIPNPFTDQDKFDQCWQGNCDMDPRYGRHESWDSYLNCKYRKRNKGLWTSSQDMRYRNGAIFTRQNNNGNRRGYECPEERDYYPYWHPTIWRDIAIVTNDITRCDAYKAESQNVKSRWSCEVSDDWLQQQINGDENANGFIPIDQAECLRVGGVWTETKPFNIPAPDCVLSNWTRDNHHGHMAGWGYWPGYNWTIPADVVQESCVLRLRYNISTSETRLGGEWASDYSVQVGALNASLNYKYIQLPNGLKQDDDDPDTFKYASQLDVWSKFRLTRDDMKANFDPNLFAQGVPTRGYVLSNNPTVDIFGGLISGHRTRLRLAVNTNQYSRTFQDRSHVFAIRNRPEALKNAKIHNLSVRGKRGNIVQVYPSVEYDFAPQVLTVTQGDFIHFQWTGSNTNPNNNAGQGTQGTDRSNIILLRDRPFEYQEDAGLKGPFPGHTGAMRQSYPARIDDTRPEADFLGLSYNMKRALARAGIYTPHVDIGPIQVTAAGTFNYICTRNHAFTNRDQKGKIIVNPAPGGQFEAVDMEKQYTKFVAPSGDNWLRFYPDPIGLTTGSQIQITEVDGMVLVTPPLFDVVPGQWILLEMKYSIMGLQEVHVLHSDYPQGDPNYFEDEIRGVSASGGVASVPITRGGYYWIDQRTNVAAATGVGLGVCAVAGGMAFIMYKLRHNFSYKGKQAHLIGGADSTQA